MFLKSSFCHLPVSSTSLIPSSASHDFAMLRDEAGAVLDVPAEGAEEGIEEFLAEAGFVVGAALVGGKVPAERLDQAVQLGLKGFQGGSF